MNRFLLRRVVYPAYRAFRRDRVLDSLAEMTRIQRADPDEVREFQWRKAAPLIAHAAARVPYYRRVFREIGAAPGDFRGPEDLAALPVLRKQDVRDNLADLIAEGEDRRRLVPDETGGSTGQNLFFYVDRRVVQASLANLVRMNQWLGIRVGDRTASLWGARFRRTRAQATVAALHDWVTNTTFVSAYKLDAETVRRQSRRLARFKPDVLVGYPSSLVHFARMMPRSGRGVPRPKVVLTSGETLFDWQRAEIEEAFGARAYNHYGSCEFRAIARECLARQGLHVAAERVLIETLPVARSASGEQICEIVITDLDNYGMPFIRYAIDDIGTLIWEQCGCGLALPRLTGLAGRTYDLVRAPNGNYLGGTFWGHMIKDGVEKFQVTQIAPDEVVIALVPARDFDEGIESRILERVRQACGPLMRVRFDVRGSIETTRSGKHRYVISKIGAPRDGTGAGSCGPGG
jgi:phenylacetate-CoA ligase